MRQIAVILIIFVGLLSASATSLQAQDNHADTHTPLIATDPLGFEMVYVPSGTVEMGIDIEVFREMITTGVFAEFTSERAIAAEQDSGVFETYEATVQGFWIDRFEVTVDKYERFYLRCVDTDNCSNSNLPQLLGWTEAVNFCAGRGARLPTESEWEYAASGPDNFIFPWGNELNSDSLDYQEYLGFELYDVGSHPLNVSWSGIYDMAGNADEWTDDLLKPYYSWDETAFVNWYEFNPEFSRVVRGGEAVNSFMRKTTYSRQGGFYGTAGFRCARFSDPREED